MTVANSDRTALLLAPEATYGTPDTSATLEPVRFTGEGLTLTPEFVDSAEITPDRQDSDVAEVNRGAGGTLTTELSYGSQDTMVEALFQGTYTPAGGSLTQTGDGIADLDFTAADSTVARDSGSWVTDGWAAGMRVNVTGSASNDGVYVLGTVAALTMVLLQENGLDLASITDEANVAATIHCGATTGALATISFDAASQEIRDSGSGFVDAGFKVGDWLKVSGAANSENNGVFQVSTLAAGAMKLVAGETSLVDESAGASITARTSKFVVNASRQQSFTVEKRFTDLADTDKFTQYPGVVFNTGSLSVTPAGIVGLEFGVVAKDEQDGGGATYGAGDSSPTTTKVINATGHVVAVFEAESTFKVTGLTVEATNNAEALNEVAELGAVEVASGKFQVSGTFSVYHRNKATLEKFRGVTETSLAIRFKDAAGNHIILDLARAILTAGSGNAGGANTRVTSEFSFRIPKDATTGRTARWVLEDA